MLLGVATAYASSDNDTNEKCNKINLSTIKSSEKISEKVNGKDYTTIVITDQNEIKKQADLFGFKEHNGKMPCKIEISMPVEESTDANIENSTDVNPLSWDTIGYYIKSITDYGTGKYFPDSPYMDNWWEGPDTAVISQTQGFDVKYSSGLGVSAEGISAKVGYDVTSKFSVTLSSTTSVPAGYLLNVKTYVTYHKKSYDVWENNLFTADKHYATGYAYQPIGSFFAKAWYYN